MKLTGCSSEEPPVTPENNIKLTLQVVWDSTGNNSNLSKVSTAKILFVSEYGSIVKYTDENGILTINDLPSATYSISAFADFPGNKSLLLSGIIDNVTLLSNNEYNKTIYLTAHSTNGIVINEIYSVGTAKGNFTYYFDQYAELYNSSDSIRYLDGYQFIRFTRSDLAPIVVTDEDTARISDSGSDPDKDGDLDKVLHISKFPGRPGEKNYPLAPHSFLVIAVDALDHSEFMSTALNLKNADWEFYNPYSPDDIDNPNVPNVENMIPEVTKDFYLGADIGNLVLANGKDTNWQDGIDVNTIIDGIEYENLPNGRKTLDSRVDKGHILGASQLSGKSLQRRKPGMDSNNSALDWEVIDHPTPGYQ